MLRDKETRFARRETAAGLPRGCGDASHEIWLGPGQIQSMDDDKRRLRAVINLNNVAKEDQTNHYHNTVFRQ